ncbi:hypothetical protein P7K49_002207 [Saguinus oedipus]|uniref:Uncharacterized protein n=1 Tax=Saguinus oedipus TaxID=9490 RepID=A0ABQ9WGQ3_SAGOE|nr:hypothetical protein P7K49_002207 [Saguinus oedipus]
MDREALVPGPLWLGNPGPRAGTASGPRTGFSRPCQGRAFQSLVGDGKAHSGHQPWENQPRWFPRVGPGPPRWHPVTQRELAGPAQACAPGPGPGKAPDPMRRTCTCPPFPAPVLQLVGAAVLRADSAASWRRKVHVKKACGTGPVPPTRPATPQGSRGLEATCLQQPSHPRHFGGSPKAPTGGGGLESPCDHDLGLCFPVSCTGSLGAPPPPQGVLTSEGL